VNPELKALIDKYVAAGATDDEIHQVAAAWKAQHEAPAAPAVASATPGQEFGTSLLQGATMGWGDEAAGKITSLLGGNGDAVRDRIRAIDAQTKLDHPYAGAATKVVAGAVPFMLGGGEAKGAGLLYNLLRGAGIGATAGAVSGAGEGTDAQSRAQGALVGGALGGTLGAAIPGGVALAKQTFGPANVALQELVAATAKSGGVQNLRNTLSGIASAGRGDIATLADLSPQLASKADFAANNSEDAFNGFVQKLGARQKGASDRLQQDAVDLLGQEPNAQEATDALVKTRQGWANQAYSALPLDDPIPPKTLQTTLGSAFKQPAVKAAIKQARLAGDLDPNTPAGAVVAQFNPAATFQQNIASGAMVPDPINGGYMLTTPTSPKRTMTWDDLHQLKQVFSGRADAAFTKNNGSLGSAYRTLADAVESALNDNVPGYEDVTAQYRQLKNLERAVVAGGKMWDKVDSRGLATELAKLSPEETDAYRVGLASRMIGKLQNVQSNRNEAGAYVNASQNLQRKLEVVFGDNATFQEYMRRAGVENQLNGLKSVVGNSATYRRGAASGIDPLGLALDVSRATLRGGHLYGAVTAAQRAAYGVNTRRIADALGPLLLTEGESNIGRVLDRIENYNPKLGKLTGTVAPAVVGRVPGLFGFAPQQ
jgi:hypothetical protein